MHAWCDTFQVPKFGNSKEEVEDALFVPGREDVHGEKLTFGLSDGASEGAFSQWLANSLVESFGTTDNSNFESVIEAALEKFSNRKAQFVKEREAQNKPLQWFEEASINAGAFSTLLGLICLKSDTPDKGVWTANSIGDTCLFQIRDDNLICQFPSLKAAEFNNHPHLISTNRTMNIKIRDFKQEETGWWETGDSFYLMTDALAQWFAWMVEASRTPWKILRELNTDGETFGEIVTRLREENLIRNDDTTLIRIELLPEA